MMKLSLSTRRSTTIFSALGVAIVVAIFLVAAWPWIAGRFAADGQPAPATAAHDQHDEHEGHDHDHGDHDHEHGHAHDDHAAIELSPTALRNIGFEPVEVKLSTFEQTSPLPAMVVERPGRSQIHITAPLTGKVLKIVPIEGAAVEAGSPLFEIGLTHEDLVAAQSEFFRTAQNLDQVNREIERLKGLGTGMIAGSRIIDQDYERQKLEASLAADRQALLLHGLNDAQVDQILATRKLLPSLTISAPKHDDDTEHCGGDHSFHVQQLMVRPGEQVNAGQLMCVLADHCELMLEGSAFEDDAARLRTAAVEGWNISATQLTDQGTTGRVDGLRVLYLADHVDPDTRALRFYLPLPNEVIYDRVADGGHRFIAWKFTPGQRMTLHIPVERWTDRIVLPVAAVVEEGAESYVYRQEGDHFDRVPVHVEYRDQTSAVLAPRGGLDVGDIVAGHGAYQIHLTLKNQAGGAIDPHAGHTH